ncbi:MAG: hypothetical protein FDX21_10170 [Chlorobium sp.]|nr:MAG: hypothetical protein FDX21_10170 [Chlorobium sp.]
MQKKDTVIMPFCWLKKESKGLPLSSHLSLTISTQATCDSEWKHATNTNITNSPGSSELNANKLDNNVFIPEFDQGRCGFSTITQEEVQRLSNKKMTTTETKTLLESIHADKQFREKVLNADTMAERMEIIWAKGFSCSTNELYMILDTLIEKKSDEGGCLFSLWGNKIS